jgi:hypothetical protein
MMASRRRAREIEALPLNHRRRLVGLIIPLFNLPVLLLTFYSMTVKLLSGVSPLSHDFLGDAALFLLTLSVALLLLWKAPIYSSTYGLGGEGLILRRFPRGESLIPYSSIERVEVYLRRGRLKEIPDRAVKYAKSFVTLLREAGYRLRDYTNSDEVVILLLTRGKEVYLISPRDPKDFTNQLRRRVGRLPVRWIELMRRGKRERTYR